MKKKLKFDKKLYKKLYKKIRKPRKVEKKTTYKRKADALFSKFVRSLDHCEKCGSIDKKQFQCAHIYSRKYVNLRYDIYNVLNLCAKCHRFAHDNPLDFMLWFNQNYSDRVKYLQKKHQIIKKWTVDDYKKAIKEIENYIPR